MPSHLCRLIVCTSLVVLFTLPRQSSADDAFQSMFNGQDLSGWVLTNTPAETFSGALVSATETSDAPRGASSAQALPVVPASPVPTPRVDKPIAPT